MNFRIVFVVAVFVLVAAFAGMNWPAFTSPHDLWLGVTTVSAPLGLIMLGVVLAVAVPLLWYIDYLRRSVLSDAVRNAKKQAAQQNLAVRTDASRYKHLRELIEETQRQDAAFQAEVMKRLDQLESDSRSEIEKREFEAERRRVLAKEAGGA